MNVTLRNIIRRATLATVALLLSFGIAGAQMDLRISKSKIKSSLKRLDKLELLAAQEDENRKEKAAENGRRKKTDKNHGATEEFTLSKQDVEEAIAEIITGNENNGKDTGLGEIGSRLVKKYSDFDVRTFGYSTLSKFIEEMDRFETVKDHHNVFVRMKDSRLAREQLEEYVLTLIRNAGKNGIDLGFTGQKVHNAFPDFNVKEYGYATFSKFLQSIGHLRIEGNNIFYEETAEYA